jgi:hypothetical protein
MSLSKRIAESGMEYGAPVEGEDSDSAPEIVAVVQKATDPIRVTNKFNLPQPLVEAVSNNKYSPGKSDYTTTQLAGTPARQLVLRKEFWNRISEDVADLIYSLSGQSKHVVLERAAEFCKEYHYLAEKRFYIKRKGKTIGGQIDLYDEDKLILYDWKETGVYAASHELKADWIAQGNINRIMLIENGYPVERIVNIVLYRDWKKSEVGRKESYPEHQVQPFEIPIWSTEETENFITKRIAEFERAKKKMPLCSDEERWKTPDLYALVKKGAKRATKLFDTEEAAASELSVFKMMSYEVQFRPGINKRCESYCNVREFCEQAKALGVGQDKPQAA